MAKVLKKREKRTNRETLALQEQAARIESPLLLGSSKKTVGKHWRDISYPQKIGKTR